MSNDEPQNIECRMTSVRNSAFDIHHSSFPLFEIRRSKFIIRHFNLFNIHHFLPCQITHSRHAPCTMHHAPCALRPEPGALPQTGLF